MQAFQSRLTQQAEEVADKVGQLSAAWPPSAASGWLAGDAAAVFDQMPSSVEAAVSRSAQDPWDPAQHPGESKQTAYERMQVGRVCVLKISRTSHCLHCGVDQNPWKLVQIKQNSC